MRTRTAAAIQAANNEKGSMLDSPFIFDPFQQGWTVKQVLGTASLGLGIAYSSSYVYYVKSLEEEELAAAEKKRNAGAKKAVLNVEGKAEIKPVQTSKVVKVESSLEVKTETVSTAPSANTAVPVMPKEETRAIVTSTKAASEQTKKSKRFLRFWKTKD